MMSYTSDDLNEEIRNYCNKYFKAVIKTTILDYFRDIYKLKNLGVSMANLDDYIEIVADTKAEEQIYRTEHIKIKNISVEVSDPQLEQALNELTTSQKTVVLENVVFGLALSEIAEELHICLRMVQKHKHNALRKLREAMGDEKKGPE